MRTDIRMYRGGDDRLRPLGEHLDYLARCAGWWELGGGVVGKPSLEQGRRVRDIITRLSRSPVCELKVKRENGDRDTIHLCARCEPGVDDFLEILKRRPSNATCDRCGS